jgi:hypothetical protein
MLSVNHLTLPKASFAIFLSLVVTLPPSLVRGDDLTGQAQDDPKDLLPALSPAPRPQPTGLGAFQPLPAWARGVVMPPLPDQLKPMGKKIAVLVAPPTPAPLAPPKDMASAPIGTETKPNPSQAPAESNPDLIAVSPFLQWVKSNPQAAAVAARQQANGYRTPSNSEPGAGNAGATGTPPDAYWLPPLIDSADFGSKPVTGSAAIYQTPQR